MEAELAPPPAPEPPAPSKPKTVAGVSPSEALEWTGSAFAGKIELEQEDGTTRRTPAEWSPWYGAQKSIIFQRQLSLPLGIILEEAGGGAIRVAEVRPGGSGEERDIRPGDVLRACSAISSTIVYGNAMFPLDGANTKWRTLAPCDMRPGERRWTDIERGDYSVVGGKVVLNLLTKLRLGLHPEAREEVVVGVLARRHGATERRQRPRRRRDAL